MTLRDRTIAQQLLRDFYQHHRYDGRFQWGQNGNTAVMMNRDGGMNPGRENHHIRRRHSEPLSLFKRLKTFRKRRQSPIDRLRSGSSVKRMQRTSSEPKRSRVRCPSLDVLRRKRCPSEPMLYPGYVPRTEMTS